MKTGLTSDAHLSNKSISLIYYTVTLKIQEFDKQILTNYFDCFK